MPEITETEAPVFYCCAVVYAATRYEPQELCENEVDAEDDLCGMHADPEPDEDYDALYWGERESESDRYDDAI